MKHEIAKTPNLARSDTLQQMFCCFRFDLDYVPWDAPDAAEFGHGEPAYVLKLLEYARTEGLKFHFFTSTRVVRAFPATIETILSEGHALDWLCKHPESVRERYAAFEIEIASLQCEVIGLAAKEYWPAEAAGVIPPNFQFLSAQATVAPTAFPTAAGADPASPGGIRFFPVEVRSSRTAIRAGQSARTWADAAKRQIRENATRNRGVTVAARPQVLARFDPKLQIVRELVSVANLAGLEPMSLREAMRQPATAS
ncbi:MAG: hypothetical protein SFX74_12050 [Fimbriimonadaceae bacterium]|nr:hypothetical protein [Fimbriimonadaceae bacterium]